MRVKTWLEMANVLWNLVQNEDSRNSEVLLPCNLSPPGFVFLMSICFVYKKQCFFSGVAKLSLSLLLVSVGLIVIPELCLSCTSTMISPPWFQSFHQCYVLYQFMERFTALTQFPIFISYSCHFFWGLKTISLCLSFFSSSLVLQNPTDEKFILKFEGK